LRFDVLAGKAAVPAVKAVLDTNVIVSALLKDGGREALLVHLALSGSFKLVVSEALLEEYEEVLRRPGLAFNPTQITGSLRAIRDSAIMVQPR
jgi:predicted nucleic acid-binding protein